MKLAWDPAADSRITGYIVLFGQAPGSYSQQINVGNNTSCILTSLTDGATYYFAVRGYDAAGDLSGLSTEISATVTAVTPPPMTALTLSSNVPSPQIIGTSVNWTAVPTGGIAPYQFQWSLFKGGAWTVGSWTTSSTWTWTPSTSGTDYQIQVAARSAGNTSAAGELSQSTPFVVTTPLSGVTLTSNLPSPQLVRTTIVWSARAAGGITPYQYRWWVYDGSVWTAATAWTTNSVWSWTPTAASANYIVRVWVRSAGNTGDAAEALASVGFAINKTQKCQAARCR